MDVVPRVLVQGVGGEAPGVHLAQRVGCDVFHAQGDDEGWMAELFYLVELEGKPEGKRGELNDGTDGEQ